MEGSPERRFPSATDLAESLWSLDQRRAQRTAVARRERHRKVFATIGVVLTTITVVLALLGIQWQKQAASEKRLREETERLMYGAKLTEAQDYILGGFHEMAIRSLEDCPARLRNWEWGYLLMRSNLDLMTFLGDTDRPMGYLMSPDGNLIVTLNYGDPVSFTVWDAATGEMRARHPFCESCIPVSADFHPNSHQIVVGSGDGYVAEVKVDNGEIIRRWRALPGALRAVAYSPNGELVAAGGWDPVTVWKDGQPYGLEEGYDLSAGDYLAFSKGLEVSGELHL